ncbi:MATE family efflux transporter [Stutzerimonas tarimensis]|uniref:MATE family efflux transporter n=1 Tax=Stutzerimonas tarimensis TaxID=1507735 RepID=A0ABV7T4N7_9GAMM
MSELVEAWRHAPTHRKIRALAAPMVLSNLTIPLVAITDSAMAGHLPEPHQLAAVAVGSSVYGVMVGLLAFLRMATTGFASQATGRRDGDALRRILLQSLCLGVLLAAALALTVLPVVDAVFRGMQPSSELGDLAREYFGIRLLGLPAALVSYALIGWFLGAQNARAPLLMLLVTNLGNVALDLIFVLGLEWGVSGIARASLLAEWFGALLGLALVPAILTRHPGRFTLAGLGRWQSWHVLLKVNRDIFIRSLILQGVFLLVTLQGARLGETTVAANALLFNGLLLAAFALDGLAHAVEALSGHAIGAGNRQALRRAIVVCSGWALLASLGFSLFFILFGHNFIALQTNLPEVRASAGSFLPYLAWLPLIAVWSYLLDGLFIAATRAQEMRNAMLQAAAIALPLAWLLQPLGNHGLWLAFLAFMLLRGLLLAHVGWRLQRDDAWIGKH